MPFFILILLLIIFFSIILLALTIFFIVANHKGKMYARKGINVMLIISPVIIVLQNIFSPINLINYIVLILLIIEKKRISFQERIIKNKNDVLFDDLNITEWEELKKEDKQKYLDYAIELYYKTVLEADDCSEKEKIKAKQCLSENKYDIENIANENRQMIYDKAKEIYEYENSSLKGSKLIDEFYGLTAKKQNKIINSICLLLFEDELTNKDINLDLTNEQIEYRRQAVKDRQVDYNKLTNEEKYIVNDLINKEAKKYAPQSDEYIYSKRFKLGIGLYVSLFVLLVCAILAIVCSFLESSTLMTIFYIISCITLILTIAFKNIRRLYCKKCGCKGVVVDCQSTTNFEIERKRLTSAFGQDAAIRSARDSYVSFDNKGNAYKTKLVEVTTHKHKLTCPYCGYEWKFKTKTKK